MSWTQQLACRPEYLQQAPSTQDHQGQQPRRRQMMLSKPETLVQASVQLAISLKREHPLCVVYVQESVDDEPVPEEGDDTTPFCVT